MCLSYGASSPPQEAEEKMGRAVGEILGRAAEGLSSCLSGEGCLRGEASEGHGGEGSTRKVAVGGCLPCAFGHQHPGVLPSLTAAAHGGHWSPWSLTFILHPRCENPWPMEILSLIFLFF